MSWNDGNIVCHQEPTTSTTVKATDYMSDEPQVLSPSSAEKLSPYCLNRGLLVPGKISSKVCQCSSGYSGKQCEIDACHNYCLNNGQCEVDRKHQLSCVCPRGTSGSRCELDVCSNYCLNDALCSVDANGQPVCECKEHYSGDRCEKLSDSERLCKLYCEQYGQMIVPVNGGDTSTCT